MKKISMVIGSLAVLTLVSGPSTAAQRHTSDDAPAVSSNNLKNCIHRGVTGANQYHVKYDAATAKDWCLANGYNG